MRGRAATWCVVLAGALGGCAGLPPGTIPPPLVPNPDWKGPLPRWETFAARYNERLAGLDRLRAPVALVLETTDADGKRSKDQVEGNLQVSLPRRVSLRLDKVGKTLFQFGSNDTHYWWMDVAGERAAWLGSHERSSRVSLDAFGLPLDPLDLIALLAITPMDPGAAGTLAWGSEPRTMEATIRAGGGGTTRVMVDSGSLYPKRVELRGEDGRVLGVANLSRYQSVKLPGVAISTTRVPEVFEVEIPGRGVRALFAVHAPENPGSAMRDRAFEFEALRSAYGVGRVFDLDTETWR